MEMLIILYPINILNKSRRETRRGHKEWTIHKFGYTGHRTSWVHKTQDEDKQNNKHNTTCGKKQIIDSLDGSSFYNVNNIQLWPS